MTAVMQPYFFPYPGYFQLLAAADTFVLYDDVQFINQGYINRNVLRNGPFIIPLKSAPLRTLIKDRELDAAGYKRFCGKWRKGLKLAYGKEPFFEPVMQLISEVLTPGATHVAQLASNSVRRVKDYLDISVDVLQASDLDYDRELTGQDRLLSLLATTEAEKYLNSAGGRDLYDGDTFSTAGIPLHFLQSEAADVPTKGDGTYSLLHLLFHHSPAECKAILQNHYTVQPA